MGNSGLIPALVHCCLRLLLVGRYLLQFQPLKSLTLRTTSQEFLYRVNVNTCTSIALPKTLYLKTKFSVVQGLGRGKHLRAFIPVSPLDCPSSSVHLLDVVSPGFVLNCTNFLVTSSASTVSVTSLDSDICEN